MRARRLLARRADRVLPVDAPRPPPTRALAPPAPRAAANRVATPCSRAASRRRALGGLAGPFLGGWLYEAVGFSLPYTMTSVMFGICFAVVVSLCWLVPSSAHERLPQPTAIALPFLRRRALRPPPRRVAASSPRREP